jgi:hypothetical protein
MLGSCRPTSLRLRASQSARRLSRVRESPIALRIRLVIAQPDGRRLRSMELPVIAGAQRATQDLSAGQQSERDRAAASRRRRRSPGSRGARRSLLSRAIKRGAARGPQLRNRAIATRQTRQCPWQAKGGARRQRRVPTPQCQSHGTAQRQQARYRAPRGIMTPGPRIRRSGSLEGCRRSSDRRRRPARSRDPSCS